MSRIQRWGWPGLAFGLVGSGCTLVSGWSDLQGPPTADDAGRTEDARPSEEAGPPAANEAGADAANAGASKEKCAGEECGADEVCCFEAGFGRSCNTASSCHAENGFVLECQTASGCASGLCCFEFTARTASCAAECAAPSYPLCDPEKPECPPGKACTRSLATSALRGCQ